MIPFNKVLDVGDFSDPLLVSTLRDMFPHEVDRFGPEWPTSHGYRKDWEVGMSVMSLRTAGAIHQEAKILGVGAGNEPTSFYLTNYVRSVHATDLYVSAPLPRPQPQGLERRLRRLARAAINVVRPQVEWSQPWSESANVNMLRDPGRYWPGPWNPRRLIVQHMNGLDLRYEDDTFDGIFSSGSIEHFGGYPEVRRAAQEMARVLKPGGVLTVSTEYRLAGASPGLPGILMFSEVELAQQIISASGLEPLGVFDSRCSPAVLDSAQEFSELVQTVNAHVEEYGEILFHKLTWPRYPAISLRQGDLVWTSCHLALRKA